MFVKRAIQCAVSRSFTGVGAATSSFLNRNEVVDRVLEAVKKFPKIDSAKVAVASHFSKDLGLDSLDQVELVMSLEDEFKIEIPDADADKIQSCEDAIKYIASNPQSK